MQRYKYAQAVRNVYGDALYWTDARKNNTKRLKVFGGNAAGALMLADELRKQGATILEAKVKVCWNYRGPYNAAVVLLR